MKISWVYSKFIAGFCLGFFLVSNNLPLSTFSEKSKSDTQYSREPNADKKKKTKRKRKESNRKKKTVNINIPDKEPMTLKEIAKLFAQQVNTAEFTPSPDKMNVFTKRSDGKDYLLMPVGEGNPPKEILLSEATDKQIYESLGQKLGGMKALLGGTLKHYPAEQVKFWIAQGAIQLYACYDGALTGTGYRASFNQPVCIDNFLMTLFELFI